MAEPDRPSQDEIRGCEWLCNQYCQRTPQGVLLPTLEGLRLSLYYHPVPLSHLNHAFPGEMLAIQWRARAFLSSHVPAKFVKYALVNFRHRRLSNRLSAFHPELPKLPPSLRVFLIEASLARHELSGGDFLDYWNWRRDTGRDEFIPKAVKEKRAIHLLIDRLASSWTRLPMAKGISSLEELSPFIGSEPRVASIAMEQVMASMSGEPTN